MQLRHEGSIIATALYNYAFPFIRYETGDCGLQLEGCEAGLETKRVISRLRGRVTDYLEFNGKVIGSPVLTVLMGKIDVFRYQIIQTGNKALEMRLDVGSSYDQSQEDFIRTSIVSNLGGGIDIEFVHTKEFLKSENKHKFIVRL